jgi:hypothetical protein
MQRNLGTLLSVSISAVLILLAPTQSWVRSSPFVSSAAVPTHAVR